MNEHDNNEHEKIDVRRWRFQFSTQTLLVLVTCVAVLNGTVGVWLHRDLQRAAAVRAIEVRGGQVLRDGGVPVRVFLGGPAIDDDALVKLIPHLRVLRDVWELNLVETPITEIGLAQLAALSQLTTVHVVNTKVAAASIA